MHQIGSIYFPLLDDITGDYPVSFSKLCMDGTRLSNTLRK
jgi:hypothetical protein